VGWPLIRSIVCGKTPYHCHVPWQCRQPWSSHSFSQSFLHAHAL
jgi:hypothetical protein